MTTVIDEQGQVLSESKPTGTAVAEFDPVEAGLAALREQVATTPYDITTTAGDRTARELRKLCVGLRTSADDVYAALNRPMLDRQAAIRDLKKHIHTQVLLLEQPIDAAIKAQEAAKEAERLRKAALEVERIADLRGKIQAINALPATAVRLDAAGISGLDHVLAELVVDAAAFGEFAEEVAGLKDYIRSQLGELFTLALGREAEAERVRLQAIELEAARVSQQIERGLREQIARIQAYPLQALGKPTAEIIALAEALPEVDEAVFGALAREAQSAHASATRQIWAMRDAAERDDRVAAENAAFAAAQETERLRVAAAAVDRQAEADARHAAHGRELQRQQDVFEQEKRDAIALQATKDAAQLAERKLIEAQLAALQPAPVAAVAVQPVVVVRPIHGPAPVPALTLVLTKINGEPTPFFLLSRPSDLGIVQTLAEHFDVACETANDWLRSFDADALETALVNEEIPA